MRRYFEIERQYGRLPSQKLIASFYRRHGWSSNRRRRKRQHELSWRDWQKIVAERTTGDAPRDGET